MAASELFPAGVVVPARDLVGRAAVVRRWSTWLAGGQSVVVAGPRRLGKSSVAHAVLRHLALEGAITLAADCSAYESEDAFARGLVDALVEGETGVRGAIGRFSRMLKGLEPTISISDHMADIAVGLARRSPGQATAADALRAVADSALRSGRLHVILLDEFQEAARWSPSALGRFRAGLQHAPRVAALFLGSRSRTLAAMFSDPGQIFYGFAQPERLDAVAPADWQAYLETRSRLTGVVFSASIAKSLLSLTGGHPYETMRTANHVVLRALLRGAAEATEGDVRLAFEETLGEIHDFSAERWERAGRVRHAQAALKSLAAGRGPYAGRRDDSHAVQRALRWMENEGWIEHVGRGDWALIEPMFGEYVRRLDPYGAEAPPH